MVQIDSDLGESTPRTTDWLQEIYLQYLGDKTVMFTMDQNNITNLKNGKLKNSISAFRINPWEYFTTYKQSLSKVYSALSQIAPNSPKLVEVKTGLTWDWEGSRFTFGNKKIMKTIKDLIKSDASIIIYMFAGGTNFERAGKSPNTMGLTTSYDFDAIVTESGDLTEKFYKLKSIFHRESTKSNLRQYIEENNIHGTIDISGELNFTSLGSITDPDFRTDFQLVGIKSRYPLTFAKLNIANGLVLYETTIPKHFKTKKLVTLHCKDIHDRGYIYINNTLLGILDNQVYNSLQIPSQGKKIQILVENVGYLAQNVIGEPKGVVGNVSINNQILTNWTMYPLRLDNVKNLQAMAKNMKSRKSPEEGNSFLLATFQIPNHIIHSTLHTYLNMNHSAKGYVFLNEHSVGKYWINGPQYELYIPECYFKQQQMENQLLIIQLHKNRMYYDEPLAKKAKKLDKSGDSSKNERENLIPYIILFYFCWFWKPGYNDICC